MKTTLYGDHDAFEAEFRALGPAWPIVWEALDYGCEQTRNFFVASDKPFDRDLAPDLQRHFTSRRLVELGALDVEFIPKHVARNGIAFSYLGRHIKVWKKGRERVPRAGRSRAKRRFLAQQFPFPDLVERSPLLVAPNRVIQYATDREFHLAHLWYALPISASEDGPTTATWIGAVTFDMVAEFIVSTPPNADASATEDDTLPFKFATDIDQRAEDKPEDEQGKSGAGA